MSTWVGGAMLKLLELTGIRRQSISAIFSSATPTAAQEQDQPTSLSVPLALHALALPVPYYLAHISDTTSTTPA